MTIHQRFLLIIVALLVCFGGAFFVLRSGRIGSSRSVQPMITRSPEEMHADWQSRTEIILKQYDQDQKADVARDALLTLTVPAQDRDKHLSLVLAFQAVINQDKDAAQKLQQAREGL
jgi:hypothetical protein